MEGKEECKNKERRGETTCKHCSKEGHDEAHFWKLHPELRPKKPNKKGKQKTTCTMQQDLESNSGYETKIIAMVKKGKKEITSNISSNSHKNTPNENTRIELFHVRVISNHTKIDAFFDSGSQTNLILEDLVKKLNLETIPHHKPYPLGWIVKNAYL